MRSRENNDVQTLKENKDSRSVTGFAHVPLFSVMEETINYKFG